MIEDDCREGPLRKAARYATRPALRLPPRMARVAPRASAAWRFLVEVVAENRRRIP